MKKSILIICLFLISVPIYSATLHVPATYPTIQDAILAASQYDDTVLVGPGTYIENIYFDQREIVLMSSDGPENTILMPQFPDSPLVRMDVHVYEINRNQKLIGFTCTGHEEGNVIYVTNSGWTSQSEISNNIFYDNIQYPDYDTVTDAYVIKVASSAVNIKNNRFYNNGGLACVYAGGGNVYNNIFDSNRVAISSFSKTIVNNIFSNSIVADIILNSSDLIEYNNFWNSPISPPSGTNNISVNPYYRDQANKDFRLLSNSLCINNGSPDPFYNQFGGIILPAFNDPDGSRIDIGAFPYIPEVYPTPVEILIDNRGMNTVISTFTPQLSWIYNDTGLTNQTDFQIQIGLDADWATAEIWDSGEISGDSSSYIYDGPALNDSTEFYIRIRLNNGTEWGDWLQSIFNTRVETFTYYVPDDYSTIQEALIYSWSGDTIFVRPGVYAGFTLDDEAVAILSTDGSKSTTIANVTINNVQNGRVTIAGFTLLGGGHYRVIDINNSSDVVIENNHLRKLFDTDIDANAFSIIGISIDSSKVRVERNVFSSYAYQGYQGIEILSGSNNTEIINNTITSTQYGIKIYSDDITVMNNLIYGQDVFGIDVDPSVSILNADYNCYWNNATDYSGVIGQGSNDQLADPEFLQLESELYYISPTSPCRDNGNPDSQYNDPDGSRNDIGVIPYGVYIPTIPTNINATPVIITYTEFIIGTTPTVYWSPSVSPTPFDTIHYQLMIASRKNFSGFNESAAFALIDSIYDTSYTFSEPLIYQPYFYLYVKAVTKSGLISYNHNPDAFIGWLYGDIHLNNSIDISDIVYLVDYMFSDGPAIVPAILGDLDGDCIISISDLVILVGYAFNGAPYSTIQAGCE